MKDMKDMMKFLADLADEQAKLAEEGKRAEASGDPAVVEDLVARAASNKEKVDRITALLKPIAEQVNRRARRMHAAAKRKAH